jgi:hypothetical protein
MEVADGLHGAHETRGMRGESLKIVHRDVSPDNVMLAYAGHIKLIDFGIAKSQDGQAKTAGGTIKGKFRYMSPEQSAGLPCDRRSDTYSLALILWEMLTGKQVFEAKEPWMLLQQVREARVVKPSTVVPTLPPKLDAAVLKALSKDPKDRPQTAHDFRRMLAEAMPAALGIDAPHISALLQEVMAKDIAQDRAKLPVGAQFIPQAKEGTQTGQEEVLRTMTIHAEDIEIMAAGDPAALKAGPRGRRPSQRHLPTMKLPSLDDPYATSAAKDPDELEIRRRPGRTWLVIGGAVVVAGAIAAILATQTGGEADTPAPARAAAPPTSVATAATDPAPPPASEPGSGLQAPGSGSGTEARSPQPEAPAADSASASDSDSASNSDSASDSDSDSVTAAASPTRTRRNRGGTTTAATSRATKTTKTTRATTTTGRRGAVFVDDDF